MFGSDFNPFYDLELDETPQLALFHVTAAYCITFLLTRLYWPLPQPRPRQSSGEEQDEAVTIPFITFEQSDFRLLPLFWGHPSSAPLHGARYAQRSKLVEAEHPPLKERIVAVARSARRPQGREWAVVAISILSLILLL